MLVKINDKYVYVYKDDYSSLTKFNLKSLTEPDECYLAINSDLKYYLVYGYDEEFPINVPQRKIRRQLRKLQNNN